ncbi:MAG: hypothetical protein AAFP09_01010 [Cyanobacteria bacterium J06607_10]
MKLGRRKTLAPTLDWIEEIAALQTTATASGELLDMPFDQWCETLKIKTPNGLKPFELFDWQRETAKLIAGENKASGRQIIVLSSRQTGKTSLFLALSGYLAQAVSHFTGVIIHKTGQDSGLLARRLKRFLGGVKPEPDNLSLLGFSSGAFLHFRSSNPNRGVEGAEQCGRGLESVDLTIIEESGHTSNLKEVLGVIGPAMTWGNPMLSILIGTAGSKASHYYSLLAESAGGEERLEALLEGIRQGTERPFQVLNREGPGPIGVISNWRCIPRFAAESDFVGRVQRELNLSDAQIASEYEMVFSAAVDSAVFSFPLVMAAQTDIEHQEKSPDDVLYVGIDPAGTGKDFAVAIALKVSRERDKEIYTVVSMYRQKTGTGEQHLSTVARLIGEVDPIAVSIEKNSMGELWLEHLAGLKLSCEINGFSTTASSKPVLVARLQLALERSVLQIPRGSPIIDELLGFRRTDTGKLEAGGNGHDDTVIALALALHASGFNQ